VEHAVENDTEVFWVYHIISGIPNESWRWLHGGEERSVGIANQALIVPYNCLLLEATLLYDLLACHVDAIPAVFWRHIASAEVEAVNFVRPVALSVVGEDGVFAIVVK